MLLTTTMLLLAGCSGGESPCDGVNCGPHGTCAVNEDLGSSAYCKCADGYVSTAMYCLPDIATDGDDDVDNPEQRCANICAEYQCGATSGCNCGECGDEAPYCNNETLLCMQCLQKSDCDAGQTCGPDHDCVTLEPQCQSQATRECLWNASWWKDSCGNWESRISECGDNECDPSYCSGNASMRFCRIHYCDLGECKIREQTETLETCGYGGCESYTCSGNDVVQDCYDRGCRDGQCFSSRDRTVIQDCKSDECSDRYCDGYSGNYRVVKDCLLRGCEGGSCYSYYDTEVIDTCAAEECGANFCHDGNVTRECLRSTCANARCEPKYEVETVQYCYGDRCSGGQCY